MSKRMAYAVTVGWLLVAALVPPLVEWLIP